MGYTAFSGIGPWLPKINYQVAIIPVFSATLVIDATGEQVAFVGRVWFQERTSTKDIRRIGFRWGTVVKAGGSGLTMSLQDISLSSGPPGVPDGTPDQTVAIAAADITSGAWHRTNTLSADRTVSFGDLLGIVLEFDGSGRLGADSFPMASVTLHATTQSLQTGYCLLNAGPTSYAAQNLAPLVVLEFSDGTFGTIEGGYIANTIVTNAYNTGSNPDEYALAFQVDQPCKVDGAWFAMTSGTSAADFEIVLYSGTSALVTVTVDGNTTIAAAIARYITVPFAEQTLTPGTQYYLAIRPTTANNVSTYSITVQDANHFRAADGGVNFNLATRQNQGSWNAITTTSRLLAGLRFSAFSDDSGGSSVSYVINRVSNQFYGEGA